MLNICLVILLLLSPLFLLNLKAQTDTSRQDDESQNFDDNNISNAKNVI